MNQLGVDLNDFGSVMTREELRQHRRKRGDCVECGRKCYKKKLFKLVPITDHGKVLEGRCLNCHPLDVENTSTILPAEVSSMRPEDMARMELTSRRRLLNSESGSNRSHRSSSSDPQNVIQSARTHLAGGVADPRQRQPRNERMNDMTNRYGSNPDMHVNRNQIHGMEQRAISHIEETSTEEPERLTAPGEIKNDHLYHSVLAQQAGSQIVKNFRERKREQLLSSSQDVNPRDAQQEQYEQEQARQSEFERYEHNSKRELVRGNGSYRGSSNQSSTRSMSNASYESSASSDARLHEDLDVAKEADLTILQDESRTYRDVLHIMKEFSEDAFCLDESFKSLALMEFNETEQSSICSEGGIQCIIEGMNNFSNETALQTNACRALVNLTISAECQSQVGQFGGIETILKAMIFHINNEELQDNALATLSNIARLDNNQDMIVDKDGVEKIVTVMTAHSENVNVVEKGCVALTNLASSKSEIKTQIATGGGAEAIVIAMAMHPNDVELQYKALRALRNICASVDANKVKVADVGGLDAIISAMQLHRDDALVQEAGAWTLSNLAVNPPNKQLIGEMGGVDVIIRAMWVHAEHNGVQEWSCRALWTLSVDPNNKLIIVEAGGISAIVTAMQAHSDSPAVQEKGCGVLANLAANDDNNKIQIVEEEALDAISMAMVLHAENDKVQDRACTVLRKLAFEPNLEPMRAANVSELMMMAAENFPDLCKEKAEGVIAIL